MRPTVKRLLGLTALAGVGYAVWRAMEVRRAAVRRSRGTPNRSRTLRSPGNQPPRRQPSPRRRPTGSRPTTAPAPRPTRSRPSSRAESSTCRAAPTTTAPTPTAATPHPTPPNPTASVRRRSDADFSTRRHVADRNVPAEFPCNFGNTLEVSRLGSEAHPKRSVASNHELELTRFGGHGVSVIMPLGPRRRPRRGSCDRDRLGVALGCRTLRCSRTARHAARCAMASVDAGGSTRALV